MLWAIKQVTTNLSKPLLDMSKIQKLFKQSAGWAFGLCSGILAFVPEAFFEKQIIPKALIDGIMTLPVFMSDEAWSAEEAAANAATTNVLVNRVLLLIAAIVICMLIAFIASKVKRKVVIKGKNYKIVIKYCDIFKVRQSQKVINFDECFTTEVGTAPWQIKPCSVCGQYLTKHPLSKQEIQNLIIQAQLKPLKTKSAFRGIDRYESGILVPNGDYLLMAFAKLNADGLGVLTREQFLSCLELLWKEIDKYYAQKDVCVPVLGSGITRIEDRKLTQQELLDIMIASYKLSVQKVNHMHKLIVTCKRTKEFNLDKIGESL